MFPRYARPWRSSMASGDVKANDLDRLLPWNGDERLKVKPAPPSTKFLILPPAHNDAGFIRRPTTSTRSPSPFNPLSRPI